MILIFGGSYNGKLDFVKEKFKVSDEDIFFCKDEVLDCNKKVICGLHIFIKACVLKNINSSKILQDNINNLNDKIIICDEIGSGIVPTEKIDRVWREETGRALQILSKYSSKIYRIFFGIEQILKNIDENTK